MCACVRACVHIHVTHPCLPVLDAYCVLHSQVNEDAMKYEHLQNESLDLKMKLKEEELLRKKAEEEQRRKAGELKKVQIKIIWLS